MKLQPSKMTSNFSIFIILFIFLSGCAAMSAENTKQGLNIIDSTQAFLQYWENVKTLPLVGKIKQFKIQLVPTAPQYYAFKFQKWTAQGKDPDEELGKQLESFPEIETKFTLAAQRFTSELAKNINSFQQVFPDFKTDLTLYILNGLGEMDGGAREIAGETKFIFGVDQIVRLHNGTTDVPFFHHELFHFYHAQQSKVIEIETMYQALWVEGLATYVSHQLNPLATVQDLMLDLPEGLVTKTKADLPFILSDLQNLLDHKMQSGKDPEYTRYFLLSSTDSRVPKRAGYYIGYLIAQRIGRSHTLSEMAKFSKEEIHPLVDQAISNLRAQNL